MTLPVAANIDLYHISSHPKPLIPLTTRLYRRTYNHALKSPGSTHGCTYMARTGKGGRFNAFGVDTEAVQCANTCGYAK